MTSHFHTSSANGFLEWRVASLSGLGCLKKVLSSPPSHLFHRMSEAEKLKEFSGDFKAFLRWPLGPPEKGTRQAVP